jgi:hypothetical protein
MILIGTGVFPVRFHVTSIFETAPTGNTPVRLSLFDNAVVTRRIICPRRIL